MKKGKEIALALAIAMSPLVSAEALTIEHLSQMVCLKSVEEVYATDLNLKLVNTNGTTSDLNAAHALKLTFVVIGSSGEDGVQNYTLDTSVWVKAPVAVLPANTGFKAQIGSDWGAGFGSTSGSTVEASLYIPLGNGSYPTTITIFSSDQTWNFTTHAPDTHTQYPLVTLSKIFCNDASIDTRVSYGPANVEGRLEPDPNWELRNLNFGSWKWNGGLFVGHIPQGWFKDRSGLARSQLWPQSAPSRLTGEPYDSLLFVTLMRCRTKFRAHQYFELFLRRKVHVESAAIKWAQG